MACGQFPIDCLPTRSILKIDTFRCSSSPFAIYEVLKLASSFEFVLSGESNLKLFIYFHQSQPIYFTYHKDMITFHADCPLLLDCSFN